MIVKSWTAQLCRGGWLLVMVTLAACGEGGGGGGGGDNDDDMPTTSPTSVILPYTSAVLSDALKSSKVYTFTVPAGANSVRAQLSGGTGNADLYLIAPDANSGNACLSEAAASNNEVCVFNNPGSGQWRAEIYGDAAYSGATLSITTDVVAVAGYVSDESTAISEGGDHTTNNLTGAADSNTDYPLNLNSGAMSMTVAISGGTGNADILLINPDGKVICRTSKAGNVDACSVIQPEDGAWTIRLHGKEAYSGVTLTESSGGI